jgi:isoleucyl-tRNA synthetase
LLGALSGWSNEERLTPGQMPELDRLVLDRLAELDRKVREACESYDLHDLYMELHNFCAVDLSAFYFDIRKDALYCDAPYSARRRAVRTVLHEVFDRLCAWLAPVLCFTAEEAWSHRPWKDGVESVHELLFPQTPAEWLDADLARKWSRIRDIRRVVTGALELARAEKKIGSGLQAHPVLYLSAENRALFDDLDLGEIAITSGATLKVEPAPESAFGLADVADTAVVVRLAEGGKCERCWQVLPEVGRHAAHPGLCRRCVEAIEPAVVSA